MKTRFIKSITEASKTAQVQMPWERGSARAALIAKRQATLPKLKRA